MAGHRIVGMMRRCSLVPFVLWVLAAGQVVAEHKVLFIGNSFTYGYGSTTGVPDLFDRLAQAGEQGDPITQMQAIGGAGFEDHADSSLTLAAINSQAWTHVVLQNYSTGPTHLNNGLGITNHLTYGRALYNQVMQNHSASKVVLYETWSRAASHPLITGTSTNTTFESTAQFQNEVRTNYRLLRDNLNNEFPDAPPVSVALVGSAWELAGALRPLLDEEFVDLYAAAENDYQGIYGYHANDRGTYLAACVFYAKIYGSSPVGLHTHSLISSLNLNFGAVTPAYLEATAWQMVANGTDPVTIIGQPASVSVPAGHPVTFQAEVSGEPPFAVQWKKNGVPISGATGMVLRIPAAWESLNGAQFTVDVSNAVSQVTSAAATLSVTTAAPYSVFVDFGGTADPTSYGPSPNDPVRRWNNVLPAVGGTSNGKLAGLVTSLNETTLLDFQMLSRFNRSNDQGTTTNSVGLPPNVTRDSLWGNTEIETFNNLTNVFPRFRIDGLAPSWRHTLIFFASRTGVSDSRQTRYTVTGTGSASVDLEVANNTAATAVLSNVASSQAGTLEVALSPGPSNNNANHFTYLGSLQIDAEPDPAPPRAALVGTTSGSGSIVVSPAQADYAVGELIHLTAVPAPGWVFTGWSGDASGAANPLVVMIDANPAVTATFVQNAAPTVSAIANRVVNEDASTGAIAFTIGDVETPLSLLVVNTNSSNLALVAPSGPVLGGSGANRTIHVTPLPNAYGTTTITISVSDGELSAEASFLLTVTPLNDDQPVAVADLLTIDEDAALEGDVSLNDTIGVDGGTFAVVTAPGHGELTLDPDGSFIYDPAADFAGLDSFVYRITDSDGDTSDALVTITVTPLNDAPVANSQSLDIVEDTPTAITLGTTDVDGDTLTYTVGSAINGMVTGTAPNLTYTPNANYTGPDSFTFSVNDGTVGSNTATVTLNVTAVNDAPVVTAQSVTVDEDGSVNIILAGTDVEGSTLTFANGSATSGVITGTAPNLTYTPNANFNGPDSFTFTVNDGTDTSAPATVSITVTPLNDAPVANSQSLDIVEDTPTAITLGTTDVDGDTLTYTVGSAINGMVTGTAPNLTYTPNANYTGPDSFTFSVNDGTVGSNTATVTLNVTAVNDAPVVTAQSVTVDEDGSVNITLAGTDVEGSALTFANGSATSGVITGTAPNLTYTPNANFNGPDSFNFTVNDGTDTSAPATVSITVTPLNEELQAFHAWLAGFKLTAEPADDSDAGGLNNHIEFLFAYDPTDPSDDLLFRLELVIGDGNVEVVYPKLMPVGDYHLSMAADPSQLANPANRVETITKAQIEAMSGAERISRTFTTTQGAGPAFFRLEFVPSPLE